MYTEDNFISPPGHKVSIFTFPRAKFTGPGPAFFLILTFIIILLINVNMIDHAIFGVLSVYLFF